MIRYLLPALLLAAAAPAFAGDHGKGRGNSNKHRSESHSSRESQERYEHHERHGQDDDGIEIDIHLGFPSADRDRIRDYYGHDGCPPGLAKKHNGCLPPGQAKHFARGDRLPDEAVFHSLPDDLLGQLRPAPRGYRYVRVDRDILLIGEASKKIIDAFTLLSAVDR